jgi:protein-S-isoprenylcysteine O-methyltransferase Ste14
LLRVNDSKRLATKRLTTLGMIIIALLIQWPTLISVLMAPVLFWCYIRLTRREEQEVEAQFGGHTSLFLP